MIKSTLIKLLSLVIHFYRRKVRKMSHQRQDMHRMQQKWELLNRELDGPPGSLLDIGCNEGFLTRYAAQQGWFSIGVDIDTQTILFARKQSMGIANIGFMNEGLNLSFIKTLPNFDVIFLLSTFQEVYVALGKECALQSFGALLQKCRKKLILETASTNAKYGEENFFANDNDHEAITGQVQSLISQFPGWEVREIGATPYSDTEPYRYMYAVERTRS